MCCCPLGPLVSKDIPRTCKCVFCLWGYIVDFTMAIAQYTLAYITCSELEALLVHCSNDVAASAYELDSSSVLLVTDDPAED